MLCGRLITIITNQLELIKMVMIQSISLISTSNKCPQPFQQCGKVWDAIWKFGSKRSKNKGGKTQEAKRRREEARGE